MSPLKVLQEGQLRRGRRGRRRFSRRGRRPSGRQFRGRGPGGRHLWRFAALAAVIGVVVLLVTLDGRASSPTMPKVVVVVKPRIVRGDYGIAPAPTQVHVKLSLPLKSGLLFDVGTGKVLWERNPTMVLPIASLTKMMTALVVVAHTKPADQALITPQAVHFSGSGVGLLPLRKHVLVSTLLYGLLLPSGNDAAIALAQHVAGTQQRFIALMNARAGAMGLSCTHYATVSGIIDQNNHSCASDLALIAHTLLEQPLLARIVGSSSAIEPLPIKGGKLYLYNNNPLYGLHYSGTDGVKTGYTTAAGMCLVATVRRDGHWLGVVLLHSGNWGTQAEQIFNAGFAQLAKR